MATQSSPNAPKPVRSVAIGVAMLALLLLFAGRVWLIPARFSLDPNEGWNALQAARALGAGPLYPKPGSLTGNNYPPLSFFIVGWLGRIAGDNIVAGRIVALASVLVVAWSIFAAARQICGTRNSGPIVGALLFLAFNATIFRSYLCMDDPQWLGHAFTTAGLLLLVGCGERGRLASLRVTAAALLMLAGGLTKQNLVAFPLAASVWLTVHDRHALAVWVATSVVTLLTASGVLYAAYGSAFFSDLLASPRHYSWLRMVLRSAGPVAVMVPMIVVSLPLLKVRKLDPRIDLLVLLVAFSIPLGILQRSGQGVDRNAHFETLVALSLATAVALERCRFGQDRPVLARPLTWLVVPLLVLLPASLHADMGEISHRGDRENAWSVMQDRVAATPGRVACQTLAFCYWAAKGFEIDFFLYGQHAIRHGTATLTRALAERRFAAIEVGRAPANPSPGEIANPVLAIIRQSYRAVLVDDAGRLLLMPTPEPGSRSVPHPRSLQARSPVDNQGGEPVLGCRHAAAGRMRRFQNREILPSALGRTTRTRNPGRTARPEFPCKDHFHPCRTQPVQRPPIPDAHAE